MNKDFQKVLASAVLGAVMLCIMFIGPFFLSEINLSSSSFAWSTYFLMLFIFFTVAVVNFNNDISKKYCRGKEIFMKKEIKEILSVYLFVAIYLSICFWIYTFLNGGAENLYKIGQARTEVMRIIAEEKPYIDICWKIIIGVAFLFSQYYNCQAFCDKIFEKIKKSIGKSRR